MSDPRDPGDSSIVTDNLCKEKFKMFKGEKPEIEFILHTDIELLCNINIQTTEIFENGIFHNNKFMAFR